MLYRLTLKVTKFQLPTPRRFSTVVKNILGGHLAPPPCQIELKINFKVRLITARKRGKPNSLTRDNFNPISLGQFNTFSSWGGGILSRNFAFLDPN